jgi:hypothetical protein
MYALALLLAGKQRKEGRKKGSEWEKARGPDFLLFFWFLNIDIYLALGERNAPVLTLLTLTSLSPAVICDLILISL